MAFLMFHINYNDMFTISRIVMVFLQTRIIIMAPFKLTLVMPQTAWVPTYVRGLTRSSFATPLQDGSKSNGLLTGCNSSIKKTGCNNCRFLFCTPILKKKKRTRQLLGTDCTTEYRSAYHIQPSLVENWKRGRLQLVRGIRCLCARRHRIHR
jgi:hypothetical protein